tara:strand:- start:24630 stop:25361 length:732 start_codon:yes stop_codon:yes gene_type:complete
MNQPARLPSSITWCGYLAITLLLILPLSILTVRSGAWQQGLLLYALACLGSITLLIVFVVCLMLPRMAPWRAAIRRRALFTLPGTIALLFLTLGGADYPRIHDITTDRQDPPGFVVAPELRGDTANPLTLTEEEIRLQEAAYPQLDTLRTTLSIDEAYSRALEVAQGLGWEIYHQDRAAGVIEAVETTPLMGFKDDIAIRVRGDAAGAYLDLRSVSRVGQGDLGANAKRIQGFIAAFQAADSA